MARTIDPCSKRSTPSLLLLAALLCVSVAAPVTASEVRAFRAAESADFLDGELDGVSIGPLGKLRLASALDKVATVEEPFLLSAASDGQNGWVVGTGNSGKVFQVTAGGDTRELFATEEPEVFSVWVEGQTVYAAGSPGARIYRYELGGEASDAEQAKATMIFDTGEQYAWSIAREHRGAAAESTKSTESGASGRLLIATGLNGKLFAFDEASGISAVVYDSDEAHLRTLLVRDLDVLVGTVGEGRILSLKPSPGTKTWPARTLYDASQPEITSLTRGPNGSFFAAAVASEASLAQIPPPSNGAAKDTSQATPPAGTRPSGFEGARSVVLEVAADGSVETRGTFDKETVYSLLWLAKPGAAEGTADGDLWIGTGQEGKLYRSRGTEVVLERDLDDLQLMKLLAEDGQLSIATTNGAALFRTSDKELERGVFSSKALDAKFPSRFGTLHYQADLPPGSSVTFAVRSGFSAFPDDTWAQWTEVGKGLGDSRVAERIPDLDLSQVPRGRYLQWRATLEKGTTRGGRPKDASGPELSVVEMSYSQENRTPEITKLEVLAPGVVLVNGSFNPSNQVFEPTSPNRDGIFNSLDKPAEETSSRPKELWKLGYRTVRWEAEDPNKDTLQYEVSLRPETGDRWYTLAKEITKTSWGFDSTVLPDGLYRVRVRADDSAANDEGQERSVERISGLVVIDHTAPQITAQPPGRGAAGTTITVLVQDALNPLRKIELSKDAGEWEELEPSDGMIDARRETVVLDLGDADESGPGLILLRVQDVAFNSAVIQVNRQ